MIHGGDIYTVMEKDRRHGTHLLDFSANINPLGIHETIREAVVQGLNMAVHYPDPRQRRLKDAIIEYFIKVYGTSFSRDCIVCGNGAADIIYRLILAIRPKKALLCAPTFAEYEEAMALTETELEFYMCPKDTLDVEKDLLEAIHCGLDLMFLCNPNNPTGLLTDRRLLDKIIDKTRKEGVFLVVDECFLDFSNEELKYSVIPILSQNKHILVLKSFTKMYAMPGLRLGYALCRDMDLIRLMEKCGQPWTVSTVSAQAGIAALGLLDYPQKVRCCINEERKFLMNAFSHMGIHFYPSRVNYILIQIISPRDFYDQMLHRGILIRKCENYRNLDDTYYRVAVSSHVNNMRLVEALMQICSDKENKE